MTNFSVPGIFWTTVTAVAAILSLTTLIGRTWASVLPYKLKGIARFYLAPALGLTTLTIIASLIGRVLPLGNTVIMPCALIVLLVWALVSENNIKQALLHALMVSVFGLFCGVSVLGPLFVYGAFNAHNDAFTYLAHSNWLQEHAFGQVISPAMITPLTTQISLYQQEGLRMGASFLLALFQALLHLRWSYEVYPAVVVAAIAACCLAIGFPLAQVLRPMRKYIRLALLAVPALSFGGLVFGANFGFLPQTIGLALGGSLLFSVGPIFRWVATKNASRLAVGKAALPSAVLFAGAVFAYSELAPFLLVAVIGSGFILACRFRVWEKMLVHCSVLLGSTILVLNTELIRTYAALRMQSGAIVGTPVDWSLLGFIAHAFGLHGGACDLLQWTTPERIGTLPFMLGLFLLGVVILIVLLEIRIVWRITLSGILMPTIIVLMLFTAGILYFRYAVPSPFPKGVGNSWSQFKLADWAHPFVMVLVLLAFSSLRPRFGKFFNSTVVTLFVIAIISATFFGLARIKPLMYYYRGVTDLNKFYLKFRDSVLTTCPNNAPIYLSLGGEHLKFRQMAALYLHDREVTSDWTDDSYFSSLLPERRMQELKKGSCMVEPSLGPNSYLNHYKIVGPFRVGVFDGTEHIRIASVFGAYDRENDGKNWWHWVEYKISLKFQPKTFSTNLLQTKIHFEYLTRDKQTLTLRITKRNGTVQIFSLLSKGDDPGIFEKIIDLPPSELVEMSVETDGKASPLGKQDTRLAAWNIRNISITAVNGKK
jgi:hypothetical protein